MRDVRSLSTGLRLRAEGPDPPGLSARSRDVRAAPGEPQTNPLTLHGTSGTATVRAEAASCSPPTQCELLRESLWRRSVVSRETTSSPGRTRRTTVRNRSESTAQGWVEGGHCGPGVCELGRIRIESAASGPTPGRDRESLLSSRSRLADRALRQRRSRGWESFAP